ncbi:MAG TPA: CehA/McbA family metallohydrolase [Gammaproteobacteria bacterium]
MRGTETGSGGLPLGLLVAFLAGFASPATLAAGREPVLKQVQVPHSYYWREMYLPQLTSGPSSLSWSPDSQSLVYSMQGSLWLQRVDSGMAVQLTAGPGYDYQPDWSPDGRRIVFVRYLADAMELHQLDLGTRATTQLTRDGAVNVDPRWSPDGKQLAWVTTVFDGHFHVAIGEPGTSEPRRLLPERRSGVPRYYYGPFDHELSPAWSPDGRELLFVSNRDSYHGTGGISRVRADGSGSPRIVRDEETNWKAHPDWAADGKRIVYSSYVGRQWHQLWATTADGGDPFPLSYGEFDVTAARWSPDLQRIAYVSNESGNTAIRIQESVGGAVRSLDIPTRNYLRPMSELVLDVRNGKGNAIPARISVIGGDGRSYAPDAAWVHADDGFDRRRAGFETHYFHVEGRAKLHVPAGRTRITVWHGLEHHIAKKELNIAEGVPATVAVVLESLDLPADWGAWQSADLHVHMNYGGAYRATPATLAVQARAEDLDVVHNLIVNKEQRIPDVGYFTPQPDPASTPEVLLLHAQEYHTSVWGHLGLLGLSDHLLIPDYAGYPNTVAASLYPDNAVIADLARRQHALVGYVHPFDLFPDPANDPVLMNALPVDAALGKVDYYEVLGFSDHRASAEVWHRLLDCGIRLTAGAGTDAMTNFASLRGPVGMNRVYTRVDTNAGDPETRRLNWLNAFTTGRTLATNGPLLSVEVEGSGPGEEVSAGEGKLRYRGWMRSIVPVQHLELVMNGRVVRRLRVTGDRTHADFEGALPAEPGWVLLRAWNESASPEIFDAYPYATTNPVFVKAPGVGPACDSEYFLAWIDRVGAAAAVHPDYNTDDERARVMEDIRKAREWFEARQ